jgi:ABC-2 type transport system ATP-binding protein
MGGFLPDKLNRDIRTNLAKGARANERNTLSVQHLQKSYRDLAVLKDVSFEVERGSVFALLGSNGAGKTTVVRCSRRCCDRTAEAHWSTGTTWWREADGVRRSISLTGQFAAVDEI